jgi:hypothetical protein
MEWKNGKGALHDLSGAVCNESTHSIEANSNAGTPNNLAGLDLKLLDEDRRTRTVHECREQCQVPLT